MPNRRGFLQTAAGAMASILDPAIARGHRADPMTKYESFRFSSGGVARSVYWRGSGPGVLLMHEAPGMTPECLELADRIDIGLRQLGLARLE